MLTEVNLWFYRNGPKLPRHASVLPPELNKRLGVRINLIPWHITLDYQIPDFAIDKVKIWVRKFLDEECVRCAEFLGEGILRAPPTVPIIQTSLNSHTIKTVAPYDGELHSLRECNPLRIYWVWNQFVPLHDKFTFRKAWLMDIHQNCSFYRANKYLYEKRLPSLAINEGWLDYEPKFMKNLHSSIHYDPSEYIAYTVLFYPDINTDEDHCLVSEEWLDDELRRPRQISTTEWRISTIDSPICPPPPSISSTPRSIPPSGGDPAGVDVEMREVGA